MSLGEGEYTYRLVSDWAKLPSRMSFEAVTGAAVDSSGAVYVSNRGKNPVLVFDGEGNFLDTWGERLFRRSHSIFTDFEDNIFCVDDESHIAMKFSPKGRLIFTLGERDYPSYTGFFGTSYAYADGKVPIRAGGPFNLPTKAVVNPEGTIFVSDGYGNSRVHKFSKDGELLLSWGEPGSGPGQMILPHGLCVAEDRVYVTDRVNSCVHVYTDEGDFIADWKDADHPNDACLGVDGNLYIGERSRVTVRTLEGEILASIGEEGGPSAVFPHGLGLDPDGNIYVAQLGRGLIKLIRQ
ncbi:MAG: SBBP repeat-containing protein [Candidatus Bathyarchaeia archaeon]